MSASASNSPATLQAVADGATRPALWRKWGALLRGWRRRRIAGCIDALEGHAQALAELAEDVEQRFVAIGASLQNQAEQGATLAAQGARLIAAFAPDAETGIPATEEAAMLVRRMLDASEEDNRRTAALLESMEGYNAQIGRLLEEERRVERIVAPLRVIQTLFRIEAAVLPPGVQAAFIALSGEIPKFEAKVRVAFAQHAEVLSKTQQKLSEMAVRLREDASEQAGAVKTTRLRASETLAALERSFAECRERDQRVAAVVREIDHCAGGMVVSLQYQDITRQKMEHVAASLREIRARRDSRDLAYLHHASRLEASQAEAIAGDLDGAMTGLQSGGATLRELIARFDRECWHRGELTRAGEAADERVRRLRATLREASELLPRTAAGVAGASKLLNSLGDVAATVASTASDMAEDMRMIALNAQVQAAQTGEAGAGLLILAERTYLISEEIKVVTRNIGEEFAKAGSQLERAIGQGAQLAAVERRQQEEIGAATTRVEARLQAFRDESVGALSEIAAALARLDRETSAVEQQLTGRSRMGEPLENLSRELASLADEVAPFVPRESLASGAAAQFEAQARRYTMDAERRVHAATVAGVPAAASNPPAVETAPTEAANVELF